MNEEVFTESQSSCIGCLLGERLHVVNLKFTVKTLMCFLSCWGDFSQMRCKGAFSLTPTIYILPLEHGTTIYISGHTGRWILRGSLRPDAGENFSVAEDSGDWLLETR